MNIRTALVLAAALAALQARADVVVVGNPAAQPMTLDQVSDAYLGKTPSITLYDLADASPGRAEFDHKALGKDPGQLKALWARLAFTGKGQPPRELADDAAVKKAVAANPRAIGYIDAGAVDGSVKVLLVLPR